MLKDLFIFLVDQFFLIFLIIFFVLFKSFRFLLFLFHIFKIICIHIQIIFKHNVIMKAIYPIQRQLFRSLSYFFKINKIKGFQFFLGKLYFYGLRISLLGSFFLKNIGCFSLLFIYIFAVFKRQILILIPYSGSILSQFFLNLCLLFIYHQVEVFLLR